MSSNANHQALLDRIRTKRARIGVIGLGYVGLPLAVEFARAGLRRHRLRRRRVEDRRRSTPAGATSRTCPRRSSREVVKAGKLRATTRHGRSSARWTSSTSACRRRSGRRRIPICRTSCSAVEAVAATLQARPAGHPRVDDLSRHDRRSRPADARGQRLQGGRRLLPRVLARARRSGQPAVQHHATSRRSSAASAPRAPRRPRRSTAATVDTVVPGQLDARRRDGEAAREHVPRGQHRPGQRDRADVPQDGHRRVGSDRRGEDQAVRVHAVLPGPGPGRPLHSDRSVLSLVEGAAERLRMPVHRAGRAGQLGRCPTTSSSAWPRR